MSSVRLDHLYAWLTNSRGVHGRSGQGAIVYTLSRVIGPKGDKPSRGSGSVNSRLGS
jgi:hypothetical protein